MSFPSINAMTKAVRTLNPAAAKPVRLPMIYGWVMLGLATAVLVMAMLAAGDVMLHPA